jgi:hypothetical protein
LTRMKRVSIASALHRVNPVRLLERQFDRRQAGNSPGEGNEEQLFDLRTLNSPPVPECLDVDVTHHPHQLRLIHRIFVQSALPCFNDQLSE